MRIDLHSLSWSLSGWRPYSWQLRRSMETGGWCQHDAGPFPATLPNSVHGVLRAVGVLPDWNVGLQSRDCEWVEHRHWEFTTLLAAGTVPAGEPVRLEADGLDYSGWIVVDAQIVATFSGALIRHRFDLTPWLGDGKAHHLSLVFDAAPAEQGQIGFTSRSTLFKPRFSYGWDWCVRLAPAGVWDALSLVVGRHAVSAIRTTSHLSDDHALGTVSATVHVRDGGARVIARVARDGTTVVQEPMMLAPGVQTIALRVDRPELWWPNGHGAQPLYEVTLHEVGVGEPREVVRLRTGFKRVTWRVADGQPADSQPWIMAVNGREIFIQGVNWTPMNLDWHGDSEDDYRRLIGMYVELGLNVLRVWGGAYLERARFYDLCDEAGLLVWQEFPQSSSGIDNWSPEEPAVIDRLCAIARDYIRRRAHHACTLLWCGGNELQAEQGKKVGCGVLLTLAHPALAALARVVDEEDPGTRFVPTSPSGPRFMANEDDVGKGLHAHVHGPWNFDGPMENWRRTWAKDDSGMRSETGLPSASSAAIIRKFAGDQQPWPASRTNPYWLHASSWWILDLPDAKDLEQYVALSQERQAEGLAIAAGRCKERFPACGGFIVWMGHDCFPCCANTAIIDFERQPKPAYLALQRVFRGAG
ncbi:MAG: hypothetical protein H0X45_11805 [Planctomycetes bacterium]|nr:hypothetical protein [Planctomycetota bacterium]